MNDEQHGEKYSTDHEDHGGAELHRAFAYSSTLQSVSHHGPGMTDCVVIIT
ncbi:hypothetical protein D3C73_1489660 [compost metagenome]